MSKSLARKKSDKKTKGQNRKIITKRHDYARVRQTQPPHPPHVVTATTMLLRTRVAALERIDVGPWVGKRLKNDTYRETCHVTAVLSDGTSVGGFTALVDYKPNEREKAIEAMLVERKKPADPRQMQALFLRRQRALQDVRGRIQRECAFRVVSL